MNLRKILFVTACTLSGFGSLAQRQCDMSITLVSPAAGAVINAFAQFSVTVNIVNNGPDALMAGDTVYYNTSSMPSINTVPFVLQQGILQGNSATVTLTTQPNINDNNDDLTANYCVRVWSNPQNNGAFADTIKANNTSCNTVTFKGSGPTSIEGINGTRSLKVYPNPVTDKVRFDVTDIALEKAIVQVRDLSGRTIRTVNLGNIAAGTQGVQVDLSGLSPGMYLVELQSVQGRLSGKFVKQ